MQEALDHVKRMILERIKKAQKKNKLMEWIIKEEEKPLAEKKDPYQRFPLSDNDAKRVEKKYETEFKHKDEGPYFRLRRDKMATYMLFYV